MNRDELRLAVERYIDSQHCILWSKSFDVISIDGRDQAIEFLTDAVLGVHEEQQHKLRIMNTNMGADQATAADQYASGPVRKYGKRPSWVKYPAEHEANDK